MDRNRKIGALAAGMVQDGMTLILDAGTTMSEVATPLTGRSNLTIPGNAPDKPRTSPEGNSRRRPPRCRGTTYARQRQAGCSRSAGNALDIGLTYPSFADQHLKEAMIRTAAHLLLVADSTKINRASFIRLGALELIHSYITGDGISDADATEFERAASKC
ncbi:DeoR/GlpR family DNA-binding transcription regulator [Pseudooceanicola spongiae]|uniref:hypothetical protein n=1 Tax=Pseudooceanicola spongiae TaxID=2613965 RepID=UPI001D02959D|nr:hypothetical protein [Pseudooceanicola spongiae]